MKCLISEGIAYVILDKSAVYSDEISAARNKSVGFWEINQKNSFHLYRVTIYEMTEHNLTVISQYYQIYRRYIGNLHFVPLIMLEYLSLVRYLTIRSIEFCTLFCFA